MMSYFITLNSIIMSISLGVIIALAAGILELFLRLIPTLRNVSILSFLLNLLQSLAAIIPNNKAFAKGVFGDKAV